MGEELTEVAIRVDGPSINSLVELVVDEARTYRSRVEDLADDGVMTVAAPIGAGDFDVPEQGTALDISWIVDQVRKVVPVRLLEVTKQRPVRWLVEIIGEPRNHNRRHYVRGGGGEKLVMSKAGVLKPDHTVAEIIDISEGGVRFNLPACPLRPGELARLQMTLDEHEVDATGRVLFVHKPGRSGSGVDVVVVYELPEGDAKRVRRHVLAWQAAERRRAKRAAERDEGL